MANQNQSVREYLAEDFIRLGIALVIVAVCMVMLAWLERQYSIVSRFITLPEPSAAVSNQPVPGSPAPTVEAELSE